MLRKYSFAHLAGSKYLFYFVLFINVVLICVTKFYPSMDGAAHLYNANIINNLIRGNNTLSEFYSINVIPIPNWSSHIILSFFHLFFPAWLAEKILLIMYVTGMALSFRFLIRVINPGNVSLSILIFPFIYSFLFHLGFYNFSISFILFFLTTGFWLRIQSSEKRYNYLILLVLITICYFSNVLILGFLGLIIVLFILHFTYFNYKEYNSISLAIRYGSAKLIWLGIASLPSLICFTIFYVNVTFFPSTQNYPVQELVKWIYDARPLIVYDYDGEEIITEQFFHVLLALLVFSFFPKRETEKKNNLLVLKKADVFLIPLITSVVLLFVTKNGSNAGMMSDRYCLIVFFLGLMWIVSRALPSKFNNIIVFFVLILHFGLLFKHLKTIRNLDVDATIIYNAGNYIKDNSIVLPVNLSDNWLEPNFSNYLGVDKPMIILGNYEASVGWFPIKWNSESLPNIMLGDKKSISGLQWIGNANSKNIRQIDNILLYGNTNKINDPKWMELKELILSKFRLKYCSENNYVMIYETTMK